LSLPATIQKMAGAPIERHVWFPGGPQSVAVFQRDSLPEASILTGPAIIEQYDACTYVASHWTARIQNGDILLEYDHGLE
ncbi:MAG: hypothetical protein M3N13_01865, partial [Candidatus Eremiobacteraeota bacterium]|nr:hypothetical protein [Candidatus Eremiobacteraeota bacterium]